MSKMNSDCYASLYGRDPDFIYPLFHQPQEDGCWPSTHRVCTLDNGKEERGSGRGEAEGDSSCSKILAWSSK